jgi:hypothetical protein
MKLVKRLSAGDGPGGGSPRPHLAYTHKVAVPKNGTVVVARKPEVSRGEHLEV